MEFLLDHIHPDDRDNFRKSTDALAYEGTAYEIEYRIIRKDGEQRMVRSRANMERDTSGAPVRLFGVVQDITEQHEIERALRDSETRFRELAELLPQTVFEVDAEGHFMFVNRLAFESFGYRYDEVADLDISQLFVSTDRERIRQNARRKPTGRSFEDHEYTALSRDGIPFPVLLYSSPIIKGGKPAGLRGIIVDITERKRAEQALRESKAKLESILESSPEAIIVMDAKRTIEDCNQATLEVLGLTSKEDAIGHSSFEFIAPTDLPEARELLAKTLDGGSVKKVELTLLREPGRRFLSEVSASAMRNAAGKLMGVILIAADVTERKQTEELIRSERDRAQQYLDVAGVMFVALDREGKVTLINKKGSEILGDGEDEIIGCNWFKEFLPSAARQETWDVFDRLMRGQIEPLEYHENCVVSKSNRERLIAWHNTLLRDETGAVIGTLGSGQDITERRQAEEALCRSEHLLRESQKVANIGHYALDIGAGTWESSEILDRIFGIDESFCKNTAGWLQIVHPDHRDEMCTYLSETVLREHHAFDREYKIVRLSDGQVRWLWGLGRLEPGPEGGPGRMIGTIQDITDRKEAEEALLAHQAKLKSLASELSLTEERERRRIAGDLHDHACQSLALSKMKLQAVLDAALPVDEQTLRQVCDGLNQTIENVRNLTFDLSSPTLYKFGLEAALEELLRDKLKAEYGIRYAFSDDKRPKPLTPDVRVLLFQSVRELLINVIKHAHADEVHLDIKRETDSIRITVGDNGAGFDVEKILSAPSRSRSVGLFNIRERLDYIGGHLEIDSHPGRGSRFTLIAPLETEAHVAKENHDGSEDSTR